jgi:ABC-type transport system involved in multi-copper enzyme maturation permease subunit
MLPGPVFKVELLTSARQTRYYALRALYVSILLFVVWQTYSSSFGYGNASGSMSTQRLANFARQCFTSFAWTQGIVVLFITPAVMAGVIADERQRKTLHYLLASQLSGLEIVVGKLMAKFLHIVAVMALGLPVMALLSLFGGIAPEDLLLAYVGTASTALFLAAISVGVSAVSKKVRDAILASYLIGALWLFAPIFLQEISRATWSPLHALLSPINQLLIASGPFAMVAPGPAWLGSTPAERFAWMVGLQVAGATLIIALATARLRPAFRAEGSGRVRLPGRARGRRLIPRRLVPRPACGDDPMMWKELHSSQTGSISRFFAAVVWLGTLGGFGYGLYYVARGALLEMWANGYAHTFDDMHTENLNGIVRGVSCVLYILSGLGVASAAAASVSGEKESDTWISLVSTDLSPEEILRAKMAGAVWALRWFLSLALVVLLVGLVLGAVHPFGFLAAIVSMAVYLWFAAALGTYYSIVCRNSTRSLIWTIATILILNGGYLMLVLLVYDDSPAVAFASTPFIYTISIVGFQDVWDFMAFDGSPWGGMFRNERWGMTLAIALGLSFYWACSAVLTLVCFSRFDRLIDRPRRASAEVGPAPVASAPA